MSRERTELGKLIAAGLEEAIAYERGETEGVRVTRRPVTARSTKVDRPPNYQAADSRRFRGKMDLSQPVFAKALGVSPPTVRAWEQGKRIPAPLARRLLQIAESDPRMFLNNIRPAETGAAPSSAARKRGTAPASARRPK
ncbi:MAG: helix-turn-helix domain-containing protein [Gemmatimonadetes bacterium]|nr:helix-turn-helix domain-containing protein [Gemmatimonadota bacterium]